MYTPISINDPIYNYRKGTADDPYIDITENIPVINNKAQLRERPDIASGVTVTNFVPISKEDFEQAKTLASNQFFVDYTSNFVYFNPSANGQNVTITYKGTGYPLIMAERVILKNPNPYAVDNLQEYVDYITGIMAAYSEKLDGASEAVKDMLADFKDSMSEKVSEFESLLNEKSQLNDEAVKEKYSTYVDYVDAELQRNIAYMNQKKQQFEDYINAYMKLADDKIDEMTRDIALCMQATSDATKATESCNAAVNTCITETNNCKSVYNETITNYLPYVQQYSDIPYKYPYPQNGWTVAAAYDDIIYRFSSSSNTWEQKRRFEDIIPPVNSTINGLMTSEMFLKLGGIEAGAQKRHTGVELKNDLPEDMRQKEMIFFMGNVKPGIQKQIFQFPYASEIVGITAFCSGAGNDYIDLTLERTKVADFETNTSWQDLLSNHLIIPANKRVNASGFSFANTSVEANDYFRINVHYSNETANGLTVQVIFKY